MAIFRKVHLDFWDDESTLEYSPEDKYFYIFLMTNPRTKQCGIYKISLKQMEYYTGYNRDAINIILDRFENKYKKIKYDKKTKEIAIKNWPKYNYSESPTVKSCILKELESVENKEFIEYLYSNYTLYTHIPNKNKKKKKNKEEEEEEQENQNSINTENINEIYKAYPSKCPYSKPNRCTGKNSKNKEKIERLLKKDKTKDELMKDIELYLEECKKTKTFLMNFSTFLNNIPDRECYNDNNEEISYTDPSKLPPPKKYYYSKTNQPLDI